MSNETAIVTVRPEFAPVKPLDMEVERLEILGAGFTTLLELVEMFVPPGRWRALAATKLQEAFFCAERGAVMSANPPSSSSPK